MDILRVHKAAVGVQLAVVLSATFPSFGETVDFSDDFASTSLKGWGRMGGAHAEIAPNGGRADGAGVVASNGEKGSGLSRSFPAVQGSYEFVFWSKPVDVSGPIGVRGGVEFYDRDGKFVHPYFYESPSGEPDAFGWYKTVVRVPRVPEKAASIMVFCQLAPGSKGKVYFDDISFKPAVSPILAVMTSPLNQTAAPGDEVKVNFVRANGERLRLASGVRVVVSGKGRFSDVVARVAQETGSCSFALPNVEDGPCPLVFRFENATDDLANAEIPFPLNVRCKPRRTTFDSLGRMFIDGKPFMPLGFYTCSGFGTNITDRLLESGANVVLSYCTFGGLGNSVAEMHGNLARLNGLGIKTIFAVNSVYPGIQWSRTSFDGANGCDAVVNKVVKGLRDAPGLLAWYVNDELSFSDMLVERRDRIAALDPDHPTFIEVYQPDVAPAYMRTTDVFGVACYPVGRNPPAETAMAMDVSEEHVAAFGCDGNPVWAIPQCHNSVAYGKEGSRAPTEDEMRSVALNFAGLGCKGFIFYNLTDLWSKKQKPDAKTAFAAHWPEVCRVFAFLKSFEPWIMGATPVRRLPSAKMSAKGNVRVYRFRDDGGRDRIVFIGGGPGESEASVKLPGRWRSVFGKSAEDGGVWTFRTTGIGSDVLESL